jgi:hypothetical protein
MSPFEPKGDKSQRIIVAESGAAAKPGDVITFETLGKLLKLHPVRQRDQIRQAISAARPLLLHDHGRALVSIRGTGYRVAHAGEHSGIAQTHRRKADRQMSQALDVINYAREDEMSPEDLQRHRAVALVIRNLYGRMTSAESRIEDLEKVVFGNRPSVIPGEVIE